MEGRVRGQQIGGGAQVSFACPLWMGWIECVDEGETVGRTQVSLAPGLVPNRLWTGTGPWPKGWGPVL